MKISEQWLREWADPDVGTEELVEQLTMAGLEVDGVEPCAPPLSGVVVGHVLEKRPHPDADRLSLCIVDVGEDESLRIVCGASNVRAGGAYPVARIGAELPGGLKIKQSKIRGAESFGMLCSAVELGIADEADGLLELDTSSAPGINIRDALSLDDQVIDLDLTPNRADCFSVLGTARDVAAVNGLGFSEPDIEPVAPVTDAAVTPQLAAGEACAVFATRCIEGIDPAARTPQWMAERLRRSGIRPLSPVVDVTNYVLLELGQPLHAYDAGRLQGTLSARFAAAGESLSLLNGQVVELQEDVLVIADEKAPVALAGIMGGADSAVTDATKNIVLESAFFSPAAIAGRARRFGLHTDASLRFERGVDFTGQARALERATQLLITIAGGQPGPVVVETSADDLPARTPVSLRRARLERLLGLSIPDASVETMLARLGFAVAGEDAGWSVTPTPARFDIEIEEDLIEEVVRLYGYDKVTAVPQRAPVTLGAATESTVPAGHVQRYFADQGFQEVITYSFVEPEFQSLVLGAGSDLALTNPLSADQSVMRRSLWPGLLHTLRANQKRQQERVRLFEHGVTFNSEATEIHEKDVYAGVAWGPQYPEQWDQPTAATDVFDIKSVIEGLGRLNAGTLQFAFRAAEHPALRPGRTAQISLAGLPVGWLGELHPRLASKLNLGKAPILFELYADAAFAASVPVYKDISRYPSVRRDLAVVVADELPVSELITAVKEAGGGLLKDIRIFDIYTGDGIENGLKSVALGLILQETSRTLTELEIDGTVSAVVERLSSKFNASIRE